MNRRRPFFSIYIATQIFKYLQRFHFIDKDILTQSIPRRQPWYCKKDKVTLFKLFFKTIKGEISENVYKRKHKFFQRKALGCYLHMTFCTYVENTGNKSSVFK